MEEQQNAWLIAWAKDAVLGKLDIRKKSVLNITKKIMPYFHKDV